MNFHRSQKRKKEKKEEKNEKNKSIFIQIGYFLGLKEIEG